MSLSEDIRDGIIFYDLLVDYGDFLWSYNGVTTDSGYYEARLLNVGEIRRFADPAALKFDISNISMTISNDTANPEDTASQFKTNIEDGELTKQAVTIQVYIRTLEGDEHFTTIYAGTGDIDPNQGWNEKQITLTIRPSIFDKLGPIQRMVSLNRFASANVKYVGVGIPLSYSGAYKIQDASKWIELPQIDTTNRYLAVTQIIPLVDTIETYYIDQAGGGAPVFIESGTGLLSSQTDSLGDSYMRYTVPAPSWDADRRYLTPALPFRTDIDHPFYPVEDLEAMLENQSLELTTADIDGDRFDDVISLITDIFGFDAFPVVGFTIPQSGAPSIEADMSPTKGWGIIQDVARSMGISMFITADGKIAPVLLAPWPLTDFDTTDDIPKSASVATYRKSDSDIEDIQIQTAAWGITTDLRASAYNSNGTVLTGMKISERFQNADADTRYGPFVEEIVIKGINRYGLDGTDGLTGGRVAGSWYMWLRSGAYYQATIRIDRLQGLDPEIGDTITVDDPRTVGTDQSMMVNGITINPNPRDVSITIHAINIDDPFGTVTFS